MITKLRSRLKFAKVVLAASLFALITQNLFAQDKKINPKDWEGSYVGIGVSNSSSTTEIRDVTPASDHYALNNGTKDKDLNEIIFKFGHLEQVKNNIFLGIELNKYSDIKTESLNTNTNSIYYDAGYDKTNLNLKDIFSLDLRLATVLENQNNFLNNSMVYGKVGVATLRSTTRSHETGKESGLYDYHIGESKARHYGTVIGVGLEKKLPIFDDPLINNNTTISLEYNMMTFNKKTSGSDSAGAEQSAVGDSQYSVKPEINNLMLTISYKFGGKTLGLKNLIN
jgi:opacity protein-like surface antigen